MWIDLTLTSQLVYERSNGTSVNKTRYKHWALTHWAFKVISHGLLKVCELMKTIAGICRATWEQRSSWI